MNQEERKTAIRRMRVLVAAACILMLLYGLRLIFLQLVNGDDFKSQATNTTDYKFAVTAARGDIVDSRGERIATSVTSYNVVLNKLLMGDEDLDGMLQKIVELLRANGESWNDTLLISQPDAAGNYTFTAEEGSTRDQKALAAMKDNLGLQQYATANDVMEKLVEDYDLASYPLSWQRTLGGIHYEMQLQAFSNVNNFIMAENVSEATVATIKEHSLSLPGVEIVETSARSYEQSTVLPHVLGRVGKITAEKWKVTDENGQTTYPLREKGYNMNDIIGISGLESAYEDELRGKDGVETITRNSDGVIVDTALTTVPEPGHTVQLTIDSRFQKAVDKAQAAQDEAQKKFNSANRLGISENVISYITQSRTLNEKLTAAQEKITALDVLAQQAKQVTAPHDGYIVEINVKAGDSYDGRTAAIVISAEDGDAVLRADTSKIEKKIDKGTQVTVKRDNDKTLSKKVTDSGVDEEGKRYIDVKLTDKDIGNLGGGAALFSAAVDMTASYRATTSTTLLPASAVRGSGDSRYVYVVNEESNALGQRVLKVKKQDVKVLSEVGSTVSIQDDLSRQRVAYMEDRTISDGSEVMVYGE